MTYAPYTHNICRSSFTTVHGISDTLTFMRLPSNTRSYYPTPEQASEDSQVRIVGTWAPELFDLIHPPPIDPNYPPTQEGRCAAALGHGSMSSTRRGTSTPYAVDILSAPVNHTNNLPQKHKSTQSRATSDSSSTHCAYYSVTGESD